jgi:hypothetical protein
VGDPGEARPGADEIVLSAPDGRQVCHALGHSRLDVLAEVVVTFGELGARWQRDALWQGSWGRSFAMCSECFDTTRQVASSARPGLVVTDARKGAPDGKPRGLPDG